CGTRREPRRSSLNFKPQQASNQSGRRRESAFGHALADGTRNCPRGATAGAIMADRSPLTTIISDNSRDLCGSQGSRDHFAPPREAPWRLKWSRVRLYSSNPDFDRWFLRPFAFAAEPIQFRTVCTWVDATTLSSRACPAGFASVTRRTTP